MDELSMALEGMDAAELALGAGLIGALLVIMGVGAIIWYFVCALGYYKMFQKAGQAGWKAFIPYYNDYIRFKIAWQIKPYWIYLVTLVIFQMFQNSQNPIISIVTAVCGVVMLVYSFKMSTRMAKSFGKGTGYGVFLFFLPFIASLILGFGGAEYLGNTTVDESAQ